MTQQQLILSLLEEKGSEGLNSYDADYLFHVKQAPTRIHELKRAGYHIVAYTNKNKSVNWVLVDSPITQKNDYVISRPITYKFIGNTAVPIDTEPRQESFL